jgi:uncharacterized protein YjbI with pentapeptide repeats
MSGFDNDRGLDFQKLFGIHRMLTLYSAGTNQLIQFETLPKSGKSSQEPVDITILNEDPDNHPKEYWQSKVGKLSFKQQIACLKKIQDLVTQEENCLIGFISGEVLSRKAKAVECFFRHIEQCLTLPDSFNKEILSIFYTHEAVNLAIESLSGRDLAFYDYNLEAPKGLRTFARCRIKSIPEDTIRLAISQNLLDQLGVMTGTPEKSDDLFAELVGPCIETINARRGDFLSFEELLIPIINNATKMDRLIHPASKLDISPILEINKTQVQQNIHQSAIDLHDLFVHPAGIFQAQSASNSTKKLKIPDLFQWLKGWLDDKPNHPLLLLGDFGHGKTTLLQFLAAQLSTTFKRGNPIPVFLRLKEVFAEGVSLLQAIETAYEGRAEITEKIWREHVWLLFCDGFDELNVHHQHEPEWVSLRFTELVREAKNHNICMIISSRPVLFLDPGIRRNTIDLFDHAILEPFTEKQIRQWLEHWSKKQPLITWDDITTRQLQDIASTPVILFLIARMFHDELATEKRSFSRAEIYQRFFDWTARTGGLTEPGEGDKHRTPDNYREILQDIALLLFQHPNSSSGLLHYKILLAELNKRFSNLADLPQDNRLFVAHALRVGQPEHVEFIHQSLREFLVAEKLFLNIFSWKDLNEEYGEPLKLTMEKPLTLTKIYFFRDLVKDLKGSSNADLFINGFQELDLTEATFLLQNSSLIGGANHHHYIIKKNGATQSKTQPMAIHNALGNALLLDLLFDVYCYSGFGLEDETMVQNSLSGRLKRLLAFSDSDLQLNWIRELLQKSIKGLIWQGDIIQDVDLRQFDLSDSILKNISFQNCRFSNAAFNSIQNFPAIPQVIDTFVDCRFDNSSVSTFKGHGIHFTQCEFRGSLNFLTSHMVSASSHKFTDCRFINCDIFLSTRPNAFVFNACRFQDSIFASVSKAPLPANTVTLNECIMGSENKPWVFVSSPEQLISIP